MNRGVLQSSTVQQMILAGNPNWWNINTAMRPPPPSTHLQQQQQQPSVDTFFPQFTPTSSSSSSSSSNSLHIPSWHEHDNQELPQSWSQLLLGGLIGEEETLDQVKQETLASAGSYVYGHATPSEGFHHHQANKPDAWSHQIMAAAAAAASSSPKSCTTSFSCSSNMLEFSGSKADAKQSFPDRSSDCNGSAAGGGAMKKARVQPSATQSSLKVRKEKLGDRITALHQLVSPFGKTDTASVLLEAIGYIRFLHSQIEALSLPYMGNGHGNTRQTQPLLNENSLKRKGGFNQQECSEEPNDLRSKGLCLVPVSCTLHVGSDNGADYWAPAFGGRF